jgi:hypothetical protein
MATGSNWFKALNFIVIGRVIVVSIKYLHFFGADIAANYSLGQSPTNCINNEAMLKRVMRRWSY